MARPSPRDDCYPPTFSKIYTSPGADVDLTAEFSNAPWSAGQLWLSVPASFAGGSLVVRMQSDPSTDVTIPVSATAATDGKLYGPIRGAFVTLRSTTTANLTAWFFWQGGPS